MFGSLDETKPLPLSFGEFRKNAFLTRSNADRIRCSSPPTGIGQDRGPSIRLPLRSYNAIYLDNLMGIFKTPVYDRVSSKIRKILDKIPWGPNPSSFRTSPRRRSENDACDFLTSHAVLRRDVTNVTARLWQTVSLPRGYRTVRLEHRDETRFSNTDTRFTSRSVCARVWRSPRVFDIVYMVSFTKKKKTFVEFFHSSDRWSCDYNLCAKRLADAKRYGRNSLVCATCDRVCRRSRFESFHDYCHGCFCATVGRKKQIYCASDECVLNNLDFPPNPLQI